MLGWSIAWPPGPINAEIVRRGMSAGFGKAFAVGLGACTGDASWALAIVLGARWVSRYEQARQALAALSLALLCILAAIYLYGAWNGLRRLRSDTDQTQTVAGGLDSARGGYALGLTLALTSPWNITFWLAVIGRPEVAQGGPNGAFVLAAAVMAGTLTWVTVFCAAVAVLKTRFGGPWWDVFTKAATGLLLIYFAAGTAARLFG
ncbi:MAG TPA: LysE family transporter [Candidatus Cybelea sp.]|nr:LysE family transporter [Candidatus Cybelea sp.]